MLTAEIKDAFAKKFYALDPSKKWLLKEGKEGEKDVYVEDKMFEFGMQCQYEQ